MAGYTKLFSRILDSTIWREDDKTRILWITMLAMTDQDGIVTSTIPGLADRARISLQECEAALHRFQQPDKYSWSKEDEGRRIREVDGGWFLINYDKYRALMSQEEQREKTRLRVERWRLRQKPLPTVTGVTSNESNDIAEAYSRSKEHKEHKVKSGRFAPPSLEELTVYCESRTNNVNPQKFLDHYTSNGWRVGRNPMKDWRASVRTWEQKEETKERGKLSRQEESYGNIERAFREIAEEDQGLLPITETRGGAKSRVRKGFN